jgi:hypothetical protein
MSQLAKSIEADDQPNLSSEIEKELERLKWDLWHGDVHKAYKLWKIWNTLWASKRIVRSNESC